MNGLFVLLFLLSIAGLIAGLIKPAWFNKLFAGKANRKNTALAFGIAMVVFFILISVTSPKSNTASQQVNAQPQQQAATISQNAAIPYTTNTSSPAAAKAIAPQLHQRQPKPRQTFLPALNQNSPRLLHLRLLQTRSQLQLQLQLQLHKQTIKILHQPQMKQLVNKMLLQKQKII